VLITPYIQAIHVIYLTQLYIQYLAHIQVGSNTPHYLHPSLWSGICNENKKISNTNALQSSSGQPMAIKSSIAVENSPSSMADGRTAQPQHKWSFAQCRRQDSTETQVVLLAHDQWVLGESMIRVAGNGWGNRHSKDKQGKQGRANQAGLMVVSFSPWGQEHMGSRSGSRLNLTQLLPNPSNHVYPI